ncbi:hypothetical protein BD289DRAFT_375059 [Coniella lustricola]|uniref:Autophagy protein n=1 Tax=Coniella lustricola TaxID=2025994 RepID=A0A2T2ZYU2_9PEZI|nr:hypothetical protein BD289DRAFT_375059 [Coniella lustricola]
MGAFDGWFGKRSDEPLANLDPKVREFLERESPVKYESKTAQQDAAEVAAEAAAAAAQAQQKAAAAASQQDGTESRQPVVPKESLYQDGRYAHLWKTYRPLADVENETKSDEEKLRDVLEAYKSRKAAIGGAALENCAEEQVDWSDCMRGGSLYARMTMCRDEVRKFERCYNLQSKLLKALGYLSSVDGNKAMDEKIQLHADKLYHQMLVQERAVKEAEKEGKAIPTFEPIIPKSVVEASKEAAPPMSEAARKREQEKLDQASQLERDADEAALNAEIRSRAEMVGKISALWKEQEAERKERLERGDATLWDKAAAILKPKPSAGSADENTK